MNSRPKPKITLVGAQFETVEMTNGFLGHFCRNCGRLAWCPQCDQDLTGKTVCHISMATHYRDNECKFNGNWKTDYAKARKGKGKK